MISQNPQGGEGKQAGHGQTITLTVSKGQTSSTVPDVIGKNEDEAKRLLGEAGFQVQVNKVMGAPLNTVRSQDPGGNSQLPKGSVVTITIF